MATIVSANDSYNKKKYKHQLKIDMTPMVDLGFLLITFFIFTTSMAEPLATNLFMPKDGHPVNLSEMTSLTLCWEAMIKFITITANGKKR